MQSINICDDDWYFLHNNYPCTVMYNGLIFHNAEAAFQAQKADDIVLQKVFTELSGINAKVLGRIIPMNENWEEKRFDIMYNICLSKFINNKDLKLKLLHTYNAQLYYDTTDHKRPDTFWGLFNGEGQNNLGKILMKIRNDLSYYQFNPSVVKNELVQWIQDYFQKNGNDKTKAVIGISGGKDSSICAALLVEALGANRVIGVLMPQGNQIDIDVSKKVVELLGIKSYEVNIGKTVATLIEEALPVSMKDCDIVKFNTPARIRMATLYAVAGAIGGRVVNTCNLSEDYIGWATKFGDGAGDFAPLANLTVTEILAVGDTIEYLPYDIVHKIPIDGLCGKSDEEAFGFPYAVLDNYIRNGYIENQDVKKKIDKMHERSAHKLNPMPTYKPILSY